MFRKTLLPAVLGLACLLMVTDFADAQRRGGGGGSRGGWNGSGGGWNGNRGNWNGGTRVGVYVGPGYGYGGYWGRGYYGGYGSSYYDSYPSTYYYDTYPSTSYYYDTAPAVVQPVPTADTGHIRVILPDPNARVLFDGSPTRQTGTDRMFHTPSLAVGSTYSYRIRATWMQGNREINQERTVSVTPGATAVVDFTQATSEPIPRD